MANVTICDKDDPRFKILADLIGHSRFDARGRCEEVWHHCTVKQTKILNPRIIDALAEHKGFAAAMIDADLAEIVSEGVRVKGCEGRIEYYGEFLLARQRGGSARAESAQRDESGRFIPKGDGTPTTKGQNLPETPAGAGQLDQVKPAESSYSYSDPDSKKKKKKRGDYSDDFEAVWLAYPAAGRHGKKQAAKAWEKLDGETRSHVAEAIANYSAHYATAPPPKPGFRPNPKYMQGFLSQELWLEWVGGVPDAVLARERPNEDPPCAEDGTEPTGAPLCRVHGRGNGRPCPLRKAFFDEHQRQEKARREAEEAAARDRPPTRAELEARLEWARKAGALERVRVLEAKLAALPPDPQGGSP